MPNMPQGYQQLDGSERLPGPSAKLLGPADETERMQVTVVVRRRPDGPPLPAFDFYATTQPSQRKRLSDDEFAAKYGASPQDLKSVADFAQTHGLAVVEANAARRTVVLSGTVAQMQAAFNVSLGRYERTLPATKGSAATTETYRGRDGSIYVPSDLSDVIVGVFGLDNRRISKRNSSGDPPNTTTITVPQITALYQFPKNSAAGQTIAIFSENGYQLSDIQQYFKTLPAGYAIPKITDVTVDAGNSKAADPETTQDICIAATAAPGAAIAVYFTTYDEAGWVDLIKRVTFPSPGDPLCEVLSSSFYVSNGDDAATLAAEGVSTSWVTNASAAFQDAAIQGVTVCIASGDTGAQSKVGDGKAHVQYPGSDPWVLAVGGTTVGDVSGATYDEYVWNDDWGATGGGVSNFFALPSYQSGAHVPVSLNGGKAGRGVPDVAANASPNSGYPMIVGGGSFTGNGTSASAPLWAGLITVLNAALGYNLGFINPKIYAIGVKGFRNIFGPPGPANNSFAGVTGYAAKAGWNACTGWGSVNGKALLNALAPVAAGSWHVNGLTAATHAALAVGNPRAYMFPAQGTQHVNYRDANAHIQELWWGGSWNNNDLTKAATAPAAVSDPSGYMFDSQGTQHVNYRDANGHIQELWWDGNWHNNDLTKAPNAPAAVGDPRGYMFDAQGTQHVNYRDANGHIQELWWNGNWNNNDLTKAANAPVAAGDPRGYMFDAQGTQHVNYRDANGHIQELWWDGNWNNNDLTKAASAPVAAGNPRGYMFDAQGTQHVNYRDVNGHIQELWWDGNWNNNDLTKAANAPAAAGDPCGYMFDAQGTQHVVYRDANGHIQELWWDGSWHNNDLTKAANAPAAASDPSGYVFVAQGTQHVIYRGTDNNIYELWWG